MTVVVEYLLAEMARGADCLRRQVAAVVTDQWGKLAGKGWNGLIEGSCKAGDCPRGLLSYDEVPARSSYAGNCASLHAEDSALRAAGHRADGGTIYVTYEPCPGCEVLIAEAGIAEIVVVDLANPDALTRRRV